MKGGYKFGIGLLVLVIIAIGLIEAGQRDPIDWQRSYGVQDKIPFGTYVLYHELKSIFPDNETIKPIKEPLYLYLKNRAATTPPADLFYIGRDFDYEQSTIDKLLEFVSEGNEAFIAVRNLPDLLLDTLGVSIRSFSETEAAISLRASDTVYWYLAGIADSVRAHKLFSFNFFDSLKADNTHILGYARMAQVSVPNFVVVKFGKGHFFLNLAPDLFTNYYLLDKDDYALALQSLSYLKGHQIFWVDLSYKDPFSSSPLRFILSQPALRIALYLLLLALVLYLIFKSKREQAAIPIVLPEPNLSVAFAETIGSLYYENGQPGDMGVKKIQYFLYDLKRNFYFDHIDLENAYWRKEAAIRLNLPIQEVDGFFKQLNQYKNKPTFSIAELKDLQNLIEDFKQKINHA